jgi:hypothetical protein
MKDLDSKALDRFITGNYGENQYSEEVEEIGPPEDQCGKCVVCGLYEWLANGVCEACHVERMEAIERMEQERMSEINALCEMFTEATGFCCVASVDKDGQILIATGLRENEDGLLVDMETMEVQPRIEREECK